ncbi:FAS1-like dehydratase domain-containing protein [Nocardia sp. CDC160]|uniref:FAS1-like dehydratase domain-containing protein n=1 Tax=Nocardia sp. CDC160 TaxID=3112166 RepID=UPI002DBD6F0E|nr:MaoC family dehydratase N-terminal domain-containing protein [Nocardia sp. CDC160]MEC3919762.1 MaoC family dehydratase N-terminal domain-containing protein [Nocardia sp. CDC160]
MNRNTLSTGAEQALALVGRHYRCPEPFRVERARIREFARAVQAFHPAHWHEGAAARLGFDAVVAPPTFAAVVWQRARREILEKLITGYRLDRIVHVDQTLDLARPLLAGDLLTCDVYFESFRHFRTFDVLTVTAVLTDQHGATVQTGSTALLARTRDHEDGPAREAVARPGFAAGEPPVTTGPRQTRLPRTRIDFDRLTVDTPLPAAGTTLGARDLTNYARTVCDPADGYIRPGPHGEAPTLVAPGMLILALAAGYVTSWTRDPAAVTKYRAEFANHVHYLTVPRCDETEIEFTGRVVARDQRRRTATVAIEAKSQGRKLFGYASAEISFAPPTAH